MTFEVAYRQQPMLATSAIGTCRETALGQVSPVTRRADSGYGQQTCAQRRATCAVKPEWAAPCSNAHQSPERGDIVWSRGQDYPYILIGMNQAIAGSRAMRKIFSLRSDGFV
jgi:hypothetical protein